MIRWEDKAIDDRNGDALLVGEEYSARYVMEGGPVGGWEKFRDAEIERLRQLREGGGTDGK